ncbi:hypothetical protein [Sinorhizobium fredii]|uniref:Uncharacterized protein n=1 Tax=Rhizobium fredii TaxID=380 RepID=A0A2L0HCI5_RHIFR|nr:hypothetical protein [Sinorhizobium fredii]AUX79154.1 hypothetical protein NXT3_PB00503 [Sinorhizobium fredii]
MTFQDLTTVLAAFVAAISAYALGYSYGLVDLVGLPAWNLVLPSGLYDASATAFNLSHYAPGSLALAFLYFEAFKSRNAHPWVAALFTLGPMVASIVLMPLLSADYGRGVTTWFLANTTAGTLVAMVASRGTHFRLGLVIMLFFFSVVAMGAIDGNYAAKEAKTSPETYRIIADDRNYVNARLLRVTSNGMFVLSGEEVIYYPSDKITRIIRNGP